MRNFRTAAVAAATAVTVAFGGVSIASAADEAAGTPESNTTTTTTNDDSKGPVDTGKDFNKAVEAASSEGEEPLSSKAGAVSEADQTATGANLFGDYVDDTTNPAWARIWREATYLGMIAAGVSSLIAVYNFAVFNGILPNIFVLPAKK